MKRSLRSHGPLRRLRLHVFARKRSKFALINAETLRLEVTFGIVRASGRFRRGGCGGHLLIAFKLIHLIERTLRISLVIILDSILLVGVGDVDYLVALNIREVLLGDVEGRIGIDGLFLNLFIFRFHLLLSE